MAEAVAKGVLEFGDLSHHGEVLLLLLRHFGLELVVFLAYSLDFLAEFGEFVAALVTQSSLALHSRLFAFVVVRRSG